MRFKTIVCIMAALVAFSVSFSCHKEVPQKAAAPYGMDAIWLGEGPLAVYADETYPERHRKWLDFAVEQFDTACDCQLMLRPKTGAPILRQAVSGAPDYGTIYVHDDGRFSPTKAHTSPYKYPDGRIYSAEVEIPLEGIQKDSEFARPFSDAEIIQFTEHELGHAVGIPHSKDPHSVFYPQALGGQIMTTEDVKLLRFVYGGRK